MQSGNFCYHAMRNSTPTFVAVKFDPNFKFRLMHGHPQILVGDSEPCKHRDAHGEWTVVNSFPISSPNEVWINAVNAVRWIVARVTQVPSYPVARRSAAPPSAPEKIVTSASK